MGRLMKTAAALTLAGTLLAAAGYALTSVGLLLTLAITLGTIAFHLIMRLLVSLAVSAVMHNRADFTSRRYRVGEREAGLYERLGVRRWKRRMPTYDPSQYDPRLHGWEEIAGATCQAERVHELSALLSFLPILAGIRFGAYPVFIVTSVLSAAFDLMFVMLQRYNRRRIVRMLGRRSGVTRGRALPPPRKNFKKQLTTIFRCAIIDEQSGDCMRQ